MPYSETELAHRGQHYSGIEEYDRDFYEHTSRSFGRPRYRHEYDRDRTEMIDSYTESPPRLYEIDHETVTHHHRRRPRSAEVRHYHPRPHSVEPGMLLRDGPGVFTASPHNTSRLYDVQQEALMRRYQDRPRSVEPGMLSRDHGVGVFSTSPHKVYDLEKDKIDRYGRRYYKQTRTDRWEDKRFAPRQREHVETTLPVGPEQFKEVEFEVKLPEEQKPLIIDDQEVLTKTIYQSGQQKPKHIDVSFRKRQETDDKKGIDVTVSAKPDDTGRVTITPRKPRSQAYSETVKEKHEMVSRSTQYTQDQDATRVPLKYLADRSYKEPDERHKAPYTSTQADISGTFEIPQETTDSYSKQDLYGNYNVPLKSDEKPSKPGQTNTQADISGTFKVPQETTDSYSRQDMYGNYNVPLKSDEKPSKPGQTNTQADISGTFKVPQETPDSYSRQDMYGNYNVPLKSDEKPSKPGQTNTQADISGTFKVPQETPDSYSRQDMYGNYNVPLKSDEKPSKPGQTNTQADISGTFKVPQETPDSYSRQDMYGNYNVPLKLDEKPSKPGQTNTQADVSGTFRTPQGPGSFPQTDLYGNYTVPQKPGEEYLYTRSDPYGEFKTSLKQLERSSTQTGTYVPLKKEGKDSVKETGSYVSLKQGENFSNGTITQKDESSVKQQSIKFDKPYPTSCKSGTYVPLKQENARPDMYGSYNIPQNAGQSYTQADLYGTFSVPWKKEDIDRTSDMSEVSQTMRFPADTDYKGYSSDTSEGSGTIVFPPELIALPSRGTTSVCFVCQPYPL